MSASFRKLTGESTRVGRWTDAVTPKHGWVCIGVEDIGPDDTERCEMCDAADIRYVHVMVHENHDDLRCGCVCSGKMSGDTDAADMRQRDAVNAGKRAEQFERSFRKAIWVKTAKGCRATVRRWKIQLYRGKFGGWSSVVRHGKGGESTFARSYLPTLDEAKAEASKLVRGLILAGSKPTAKQADGGYVPNVYQAGGAR